MKKLICWCGVMCLRSLCLALDYFLFILLQTLNCSLEELTYPVTMATTSCTLHTTMHTWIFCHGMFTKVSTTIINKMTHNQVSIGLLYSAFPLTAIMFCHVSSNPMAVPNIIFTRFEKKDQNTIWKKIKKF